jgi:hypothetical protein
MSVHTFVISQLLLEEMILYLIHGFGMVTCTVSPLSRFTAHLLPVYRVTYKSADRGHFEARSGSLNTILEVDHLRTINDMFAILAYWFQRRRF